ncbi:MAG: hypothetical protein HONBIEJF_02760 [Fimbriimonadaceae bacterium]|nr:hypothetical protein [Fimbriimonadaceae bacterium]
MRVNYIVLCETAAQLRNGSPVLFGIFRELPLDEFPATLPPMMIAMEIEADPDDVGRQHELDVLFVNQDNRVVAGRRIVIEFASRPDHNPNYCFVMDRFQPQNQVDEPGVYRFDVIYEEERLNFVRLTIRHSDNLIDETDS